LTLDAIRGAPDDGYSESDDDQQRDWAEELDGRYSGLEPFPWDHHPSPGNVVPIREPTDIGAIGDPDETPVKDKPDPRFVDAATVASMQRDGIIR
jgi:hypothetical protein